MADTRVMKVVRDVWLHRSRTVLVVLAIAVGMLGAGAVLDTWALLRRVTRDQFLASNPASATLRTSAVDAGLLAVVRGIPGVRAAQARRTVTGAVRTLSGWRTAVLFVRDDFASRELGALRAEVGTWPPPGVVAIERSSLAFSGLSVGEPASFSVAGREVELPLDGIIRDVSLAPGWMEHVVYGFIAPGTLPALGLRAEMNDVALLVDPALDRTAVRRIAFAAKAAVEGTGRRVTAVDVPEPGEHMHAAQMDSLLYTQGAFGVLSLLLAGFLVVNLVTAMLAGQVREIGVMKVVGAEPRQIAVMYLGLALLLGLVASALAIPVAALIGRQYATLKAELLNFDLSGTVLPAWAILAQVLTGAALPVLAAAIPVVRGCRISVAAALRDVGIANPSPRTAFAPRATVLDPLLSRPLVLSLRNAFRRRGRLIMTMLALSAGGAIFLGALNLKRSVQGAVDLLYAPMRFAFSLRLTEPVAPESLEAVVRAVPGVAAAEAWAAARAVVAHDDGTESDPIIVTAPPAATALLRYEAEAGRWLQPGDTNALVASRQLLAEEPAFAVGNEVTLTIGGTASRWTVVGVVSAGPAAQAFVAREALGRARGAARVDRVAVAVAGSSSPAFIGEVRAALERRGMAVQSSQLMAEARRVMEDHLLMVVDFLGAMAWLMLIVGGLGLASTMSIAVLERTREIGVMRAIGAPHRAIHAIVHAEGLVIALLAWAVAVPLSVPMSVLLGRAFGRIMLPVPLIWLPGAGAMALWLGMSLAVSVLACALPARRATRMPTRAALAYE